MRCLFFRVPPDVGLAPSEAWGALTLDLALAMPNR